MTAMLALKHDETLHRRPFVPGHLGGQSLAADIETRPVVHVIDTDEAATRTLVALCESRGLKSRAYESFGQFAAVAPPEGPGCLVIEVQQPSLGRPGWSTLLKPHLRLPMVVTASRPDIAMAVEAMKCGAIDFLERPFREDEMVDALTAALEADQERRTAHARRSAVRERFDRLTRREREVMALVTAGRLNKQVAGDLGLSEITVKVHRGSAMRKMGARTLVDLVRMADVINRSGDWPVHDRHHCGPLVPPTAA